MKRLVTLLTIYIYFHHLSIVVASFQLPLSKTWHESPCFFPPLSNTCTSSGNSRRYTSTHAFNGNHIEYSLINDINLIPASEWDGCLPPSHAYPGETTAPFLKHAFLSSLETSQCVSPHRGWFPRHLQIKVNGDLAAYVPIYIKYDSMGEFIFDAEWADFAKTRGISYYPKLLVGVPFSPVTCEKILMERSFRKRFVGTDGEAQLKEFRLSVGKKLQSIVKESKLSSAHINFITQEEAFDIAGDIMPNLPDSDSEGSSKKVAGKSNSILNTVMKKFTNKEDYIRKTTFQYHWVNARKGSNEKYTSFDDYLSCFKSKKRITIKRERRRVLEQNVRVDAISGKDILHYPGLVERMYEIYKSTVQKMFWGNLYFNLDFFELLVESDFVESLVIMCARLDDGSGSSVSDNFHAKDVFAGTINVIENGVFYGRYWGCLPSNDIKNLHFEVCYWKAIEFCITNGLDKMEPGAGGGDYKWVRGFDPVLIHSVHYIAQPSFRRAVRNYVNLENKEQIAIAELLIDKSSVKGSKSSSGESSSQQ